MFYSASSSSYTSKPEIKIALISLHCNRTFAFCSILINSLFTYRNNSTSTILFFSFGDKEKNWLIGLIENDKLYKSKTDEKIMRKVFDLQALAEPNTMHYYRKLFSFFLSFFSYFRWYFFTLRCVFEIVPLWIPYFRIVFLLFVNDTSTKSEEEEEEEPNKSDENYPISSFFNLSVQFHILRRQII